jgi:hypothetical protein
MLVADDWFRANLSLDLTWFGHAFRGVPLVIGSLEWFGAGLGMLRFMYAWDRKILITAVIEADIPVGSKKESS